MLAACSGSQRLGISQSSFSGVRISAPTGLQRGPGKKWEHYPLNHNNKVIRQPMHVRTGDTVQVISGKDKGKVGEVEKVITKSGMILVKGVNIKYKTKQPQQQGEKGSIEQSESPIHHSNAMLYSKEQQVRSKVGHKFLDDGKKVRYLRKTGEVLDK